MSIAAIHMAFIAVHICGPHFSNIRCCPMFHHGFMVNTHLVLVHGHFTKLEVFAAMCQSPADQ